MTTAVQDVRHLSERTDAVRQMLNKKLAKKEKLGQYFSSSSVANLMSSMMDYPQKNIKILDPGAGVGSLFTACVQRICGRKHLPDSIQVVAYEVDDLLFDSIDASLMQIGDVCKDLGVGFSGTLVKRDFLEDYAVSSDALSCRFTHVIMNPPYEKIKVSSKTYDILRGVGLQTTNMYSAFIAVSHNLLGSGGQMTFISPRSFCNGTYFHHFRRDFLGSMSPKKIHLFSSRTSSFSDDGVLQENVIICARKNGMNQDVIVSSSCGPADDVRQRRVKKSDIIFDDDPQMFIHIVPDEEGAQISEKMRDLPCTLKDIGIEISTGRVVDFRIRDELRFADERGAVPLVRPFNISCGTTRFPGHSKKHCNFIMANEKSRKLLVGNGNYVLVKRFTTVEQKRRVTASVWTRNEYDSELIGFENRVNYFHSNGAGLTGSVARGLCAFLNSSAVDAYFRQFSGNTQVNAADLRYLRYPSRRNLGMLGNSVVSGMGQDEIDRLVDGLLFDSVMARH